MHGSEAPRWGTAKTALGSIATTRLPFPNPNPNPYPNPDPNPNPNPNPTLTLAQPWA